jgi:cell wall-associated NlpC family hydrolase
MIRFLNTRYVEGGRGPYEYDCWGIVRAVRHEVFHFPLLPSHSEVAPADKDAMTAVCQEIIDCAGLKDCTAQEGAIAAAWAARLCVHVGIVVQADGRLWVLETDKPTGPCMTPLRVFENRYTRVTYHD